MNPLDLIALALVPNELLRAMLGTTNLTGAYERADLAQAYLDGLYWEDDQADWFVL